MLAVDPSSPIAGGSILGDKTRMEELSRREDAFIRPSPAGSAPGGVARKTRESMLLCEAAGFDTVIVETVGAGQSEYEVAGMVDCFIVLLLPNAGDELQGIKKGILELADALVINKADGEGAAAAETARGDYAAALSLLRHPAHWQPPVLACSAKEGAGIPEIWRMVGEFEAAARAAGAFQARRAKQSLDWMRALVDDFLRLKLAASAKARRLKPRLEQEVAAGKTTPRAAAQQIIDCL